MSTPNPAARKYYDEAEKLFEENKFDEAIKLYNKAIEADDKYASAYFNRALSYALLKEYESAARDAVAAMQLEPECCDGPYVLGVIREYQNDYVGAAKWYHIALSKNLQYEQARDRLSKLENKLRGGDSTIGDFDAAKTSVQLVDPFGTVSHERLGQTIITEGQIKGVALFRPNKKLEDAIGLEQVKQELELSVIGPAMWPEGLKRWNLERGISVLLYGPSGCGKTLLVEALAGELGAYILIFKLHEVLDMYVGNTEKNIHTVFEEARNLIASKKTSHVVIFMDELDALGMNRSLEREDTGRRAAVNELLAELDGVERSPEGLIIIGATNRPWDIDPALTRAGRFGDEWYVNVPTTSERKELFEYYLRGVPTSGIDTQRLAEVTETYSPADIMLVVKRAERHAFERERTSGKEIPMTTDDLMEIIKDNQTSSLHDWFLSVAEEFATRQLDRAKYKRLLDDMEAILGSGDEAKRQMEYG